MDGIVAFFCLLCAECISLVLFNRMKSESILLTAAKLILIGMHAQIHTVSACLSSYKNESCTEKLTKINKALVLILFSLNYAEHSLTIVCSSSMCIKHACVNIIQCVSAKHSFYRLKYKIRRPHLHKDFFLFAPWPCITLDATIRTAFIP